MWLSRSKITKVNSNDAILHVVGRDPKRFKEVENELTQYCEDKDIPVLYSLEAYTSSLYLEYGEGEEEDDIEIDSIAYMDRDHILSCLEKGEQFAHVICHKFNNLFDDPFVALSYIQEWERWGVKVHCLDLIEKGVDIYTPEGKHIFINLLNVYSMFSDFFK